MRTITFLSLLILLNYSCFGQYFEGIIVYKSQFFGNSPNIKNRIDTITYLVKGNMIKSPSIMMPGNGYTLLKDGKYYQINDINHSISEDISYDIKKSFYDEIKSIRRSSKNEEILGIPVQHYTGIRNLEGKQEFSELFLTDSIMPQIDFSYFLCKDVGIVLRLIQTFPIGTRIAEIINIIPTQLNDSIFQLPDYPIKQVDISKLTKAYIKDQKK